MSGTAHHMDRAMRMAATSASASRFDREIARARRHSVLVRTLRIGLPAAAFLILAGGIAVTWVARSVPDNVSVAGATIDSRGVVMQDPRLSGFDKMNRPYSMIAERAIQQLGGSGVDLEKIRANVTVGENTKADIVAATGFYDQAAQKLRLSDDVRVVTSDGMTLALRSADIDLKGGTMTGTGPVEIVTDGRTIRAGSVAVSDGGSSLTFGQRVRMTLTMSPNGVTPPNGATPSAAAGSGLRTSLNPSPENDSIRRDYSSIEVR